MHPRREAAVKFECRDQIGSLFIDTARNNSIDDDFLREAHPPRRRGATSPMVRLVVAAMLWAAAGNAQAQEVGNAQQGLRLARQVCSPCHLVVKEAGRSTNPDAPTFETIAKTKGLTGAALTSMLETSHRTMPNIVIKGSDINDITAYILSLKEGD